MQHLLSISEQHNRKELDDVSDNLKIILLDESYEKMFVHNQDKLCFRLYNDKEGLFADTSYFVGVDWIVLEKAAIYIEPKLNDKKQVNFLDMLLKSLEAPENIWHLDNLFHVDYDQAWIDIPEQKDLLSPILIVQFIKLVQKIVRKGLKKSYWRTTQNLDSRIKGKILVSQQIKHNIVKNRLTKTICNYQEYSVDTIENQFLKFTLEFVSSYINQKTSFFTNEQTMQLKNIIRYSTPAFEHVALPENIHQHIHVMPSPFYKEYKEAIKIGEYILKRFSFNINKASQSQTSTPPFWIDMSKLFELYVFGKLKKLFLRPGDVTYHDAFRGGKETDILIKSEGYKCVIDCKYKPAYENNSPSLEDKRQLAGYTRLKGVYNKLAVPHNEVVKGLIIYSHQSCPETIQKEHLFGTEIGEYLEFYRLGLKLPDMALPS